MLLQKVFCFLLFFVYYFVEISVDYFKYEIITNIQVIERFAELHLSLCSGKLLLPNLVNETRFTLNDNFCLLAPKHITFYISKLNLNTSKEVALYIKTNTSNMPYYQSEVNIVVDKNLFYVQYYSIVLNNRLSFPYSNCLDYSSLGLRTQDECLYKCLRNKFSFCPKEFICLNNETSKYIFKAIENQNEIVNNKKKVNNCWSACKQAECKSQNIVLGRSLTYLKQNRLNVELIQSKGKMIDYKAKLTIEFYIFYIGSLTSTVFGFYILELNRLNELIIKLIPRSTSTRNLKKHISKLFRLGFYFFTIVGVIYQSIDVIIIYLNYEYVTETYLGLPYEVVVPSVSVCAGGKQFKGKENLLVNLELERFVKRIVLIPTKTQKMVLYNETQFKTVYNQYFRDDLKCFKINCLNHGLPSYATIFKISHVIYFKKINVKFKFYIHPYNDFVRGIDPLYIYFSPTYSKQCLASVSHQRFELLSFPYASDCRNYKMEGFNSRDHCIDKCIIKKSEKIINYFNLTNLDIVVSGDKKVLIRKTCQKKFCKKQDCLQEKFILTGLTITKLRKSTFQILYPKFTDTIKMLPSLSLITFAIWLGGILGFWLGISLITPISCFYVVYKVNRYHKILLNIIFYIISVITLIYQIFIILQDYTEYESITNTVMGRPYQTSLPPQIFIGGRIKDLLKNRSGLYSDAVLLAMSPKKIYDITLNLDDLIKSIQMRNLKTYEWINITEDKFSSVFAVSSFVQSNAFFYKIELITQIDLMHKLIFNSDPGELLRIQFNQNMRELIQIFSEHSFQNILELKEKNVFIQLHFSHEITKSYLLPSPYKTRCVNYGEYYSENNIGGCYLNYARKFNETTIMALLPVYVDYPRTTNKVTFIENCEGKHYWPSCTMETSSLNPVGGQSVDRDTVTIMAPNIETTIIFYPKTNLSELFIYVGGLFGIWWGISLLDIINIMTKYLIMFVNKDKRKKLFTRRIEEKRILFVNLKGLLNCNTH